MDVLKEIITWSKDRPKWQQDALRRLLIRGALEESDFDELVEICKHSHGLSENDSFRPIQNGDIPSIDKTAGKVNLVNVRHTDGVNALAKDQAVSFGPGLTIVYGDNGAGKSGYTRILKQACEARGREEILGNVHSESLPPKLQASVKYTVGDDPDEQTWTSGSSDSSMLRRVSVFDSHSASIYLSEKTDVAFRPFGLDLFDKLSDACEEISKRLSKESKSLEDDPPNFPELSPETVAGKAISNVTSLTDELEVRELCSITDEDTSRLELLTKQVKDLNESNPKKKAETLQLLASRLESLSKHIQAVETTINNEVVDSLVDHKKRADKLREQGEELKKTAFPPELLTGTGSPNWKAMWSSAESFSTKNAYVDKGFPFTENGAKCVLCQQPVEPDAAARLQHFHEFTCSTNEKELKRVELQISQALQPLKQFTFLPETTTQTLAELAVDHKKLAESIEVELKKSDESANIVVNNFDTLEETRPKLAFGTFDCAKLQSIITELKTRSKSILDSRNPSEKERLEKELLELDARIKLAPFMETIVEEIGRKKRLAAFNLCIQDTKTSAITRKSTEVTKEVVTDQLKSSFISELKLFNFDHIEVELKEAGGTRGSLYHKLILKRAPNIEVPKVVSEGEARCLSIAAFFAELCTASDPSTILFDDPVSSLDHHWRAKVAKRLVREAKKRQVIVFTHDIVFLLALHRYADETNDVILKDQHLRRNKLGAGVSKDELPWAAMKVRKRIGVLKDMWQAAEKKERTGDDEGYERKAIEIYGYLRETWERALEETLLGGTVERYRESIQTQQIRALSDVTQEDCEIFENGMSKTSKWLRGHDSAPAENEPVPGADDLKSDIDSLESWVKSIQKRR